MTDIGTLVEEIRNHRFDGYSAVFIAAEIDKFRSGAGAGSINAAVDALRSVSTALAETEQTLRTELDRLGVSWQGDAALSAGAAITEEAGFSREMGQILDGAAEALFAQGDAFNRTRDKLPEAEQVRKAGSETTLGDELLSLIGFETDHAEQIADAKEAKQHAVQVLNQYAMESGANLGAAERGTEPEVLAFSVASPTPEVVNAGGGPVAAAPVAGGVAPAPAAPVPAGAGPATTQAAGAVGSVAPALSTPAATTPPPTASYAPTAPPGPYDPPTPPAGLVAPGAGVDGQFTEPGGADSSSTSASGVAPPPLAPSVPAGGGAGAAAPSGIRPGTPEPDVMRTPGAAPTPGAGQPSTGTPGGATARPGGRVIGRINVAAPGVSPPASQPPAGGVVGRPLTPIKPGDAAESAPLARGRSSGLTAQPSTSGSYGASAYVARPRAVASAAELSAGAAAIGAGGTAGAMGGDQERQGRGVGRSAPHAGTSQRQADFGAGPDEDEADAARRAERGTRSGRQVGGLMARAAPQEGYEDGEHVRSHGIDDSDLFSDQRMVAPERIDAGEADESDTDR